MQSTDAKVKDHGDVVNFDKALDDDEFDEANRLSPNIKARETLPKINKKRRMNQSMVDFDVNKNESKKEISLGMM